MRHAAHPTSIETIRFTKLTSAKKRKEGPPARRPTLGYIMLV